MCRHKKVASKYGLFALFSAANEIMHYAHHYTHYTAHAVHSHSKGGFLINKQYNCWLVEGGGEVSCNLCEFGGIVLQNAAVIPYLLV